MRVMVTIKDVAKEAGVSISTASYALNNRPNVHPETRERILRVAEKLNYYPNANARNLKTKKTGNIGVFIYGFGGPIFSDLLEGINNELQKKDYNIVVSSGQSSSIMLRERQVDAAIIFDSNITDQEIFQYAKNNPIVVLDRHLEGINIYKTMIPNETLVYTFLTQMVQKGYKKLSYLSGPNEAFNNKARYEGFKRVLKEQGLTEFSYMAGDFTTYSGYEAGLKLAETSHLPDFVYCANDEMAIGVIKALNEKNIKVPQQIAVAGFDGIVLNEYITPKLTTIEVNHGDWGHQIAGFLIRVLRGKNVYPLTDPEAKIVIRESV